LGRIRKPIPPDIDTSDNEQLLELSRTKEGIETLKDIWWYETRPFQTSRIKDLREGFIDAYFISKTKLDVLDEGIPPTATLQEIPKYAKKTLDIIDFPTPEEKYTTSEGNPRSFMHSQPSKQLVQTALALAKKRGLLRDGMDLPLRRLWYAFIKANLERGVDGYIYGFGKYATGLPREPSDGDYVDGFADIIKETNLWYSDFGVRNPSATAEVRTPKLFLRPIIIRLEKRSYYDVLKNMATLLGLSIYSAGGQSRFSEQEVLAKRVYGDIFENHPERENLDIFVISDFDPAGIDIAINIGEHQKFYQERFGKNVETKRIAPLPKHYTPKELEEGIYTVKNEDRKTWNYDKLKKKEREDFEEKGVLDMIKEISDTREKYNLDRKQGLEVESLPDQPLKDILRNPPADWDSRDYNDPQGDWKSLTRMRFILFDELIEKYGIDGAFLYLLKQKTNPAGYGESFDTKSMAGKLIDKGEAGDISGVVKDAYGIMSSIDDEVVAFIDNYLQEDKLQVAENINNWLDDVIAKYTDETHEKYDEKTTKEMIEKLKNKLYAAIAKDKSYFNLSFPEDYKIEKVKDENDKYYPSDFKITIPDAIVDNMRPIIDWALCMELNAQEVSDYFEDLKKPVELDSEYIDLETEIEELEEEKNEEEYDSERWNEIEEEIKEKKIKKKTIESQIVLGTSWDIPPVRGCKIITEDEERKAIFSEPAERCKDLEEKIDDLETQISNLEEDKEKYLELWRKKKEEITEEEITEDYSEEIAELNEKIKEYEEKLEECLSEKTDCEENLRACREEMEVKEREIKVKDEALEGLRDIIPPTEEEKAEEKVEKYIEREKLRAERKAEDVKRIERGEMTGTEFWTKWKEVPPPVVLKPEEIEWRESERRIEELAREMAGQVEYAPFRYWYARDIEDKSQFDTRIRRIRGEIRNDPPLILVRLEELINELISVQALPDPYSIKSLEINRLSDEMKKIHYRYGMFK